MTILRQKFTEKDEENEDCLLQFMLMDKTALKRF
jgi:hypothetical protein